MPSSIPGVISPTLLGTAVLSPCDAWAVGYTTGHSVSNTLIERWDGAAWTQYQSPNPGTGNATLQGVGALSATDAWAERVMSKSGDPGC
jgi:hypothetical protein